MTLVLSRAYRPTPRTAAVRPIQSLASCARRTPPLEADGLTANNVNSSNSGAWLPYHTCRELCRANWWVPWDQQASRIRNSTALNRKRAGVDCVRTLDSRSTLRHSRKRVCSGYCSRRKLVGSNASKVMSSTASACFVRSFPDPTVCSGQKSLLLRLGECQRYYTLLPNDYY